MSSSRSPADPDVRFNGVLTVIAHRARDLRRVSRLNMDPYVVAAVGKVKQKNYKCDGGNENPVWLDLPLEFPVRDYKPTDVFRLKVKNEEFVVDDTIGEFAVPLEKLIKHLGRKWVRLLNSDNDDIEHCGDVEISVWWKGTPAGIYDAESLRGPTTKVRKSDLRVDTIAPNQPFSIFSDNRSFCLQPACKLSANGRNQICKLVWSSNFNDNHFYVDGEGNLRHLTSNGYITLFDRTIYRGVSGSELAVAVGSCPTGNRGKYELLSNHELQHVNTGLGIVFQFEPFTQIGCTVVPAILGPKTPCYPVLANNEGGFTQVDEATHAMSNLSLAPAKVQPAAPQPEEEHTFMTPSAPFYIIDCESGMAIEPDECCQFRLVSLSDQDRNHSETAQFHWFLTHLRHSDSGLVTFQSPDGDIYLDSLDCMGSKLLHIQLERDPAASATPNEKGFGRGYLKVMIDDKPMYFQIARASDGSIQSVKLVPSSSPRTMVELKPVAQPALAPVAAASETEQKVESVRPSLKRLETASISETTPFYLQCAATGQFLGVGPNLSNSDKRSNRALSLVTNYTKAIPFVFQGPQIKQAFGKLLLGIEVVNGVRQMVLVSLNGSDDDLFYEMSTWFEFTPSHRIRELVSEETAKLDDNRIVFTNGDGMEFKLYRVSS